MYMFTNSSYKLFDIDYVSENETWTITYTHDNENLGLPVTISGIESNELETVLAGLEPEPIYLSAMDKGSLRVSIAQSKAHTARLAFGDALVASAKRHKDAAEANGEDWWDEDSDL